MIRRHLAFLALSLSLSVPASAKPLVSPALEELKALSPALPAPASIPDFSRRELILQYLAPPATSYGLTPAELMRIYGIADYIAKNYVDPVEAKKLYYAALKGMAQSLDPYSDFFTADEAKAWNQQLSGSISGIGVQLMSKEAGQPLGLRAVYPGSPAEKAGLKAGDRITAVDGTDILPLSLEDSRKKIVGKKGTSVTLTFKRLDPAAKKDVVMTLTVTRDDVHVPEAFSKMLPGKVGYLYFSIFGYDTDLEVLKQLRDLKKKGAKSFILDVRGNPGGSLGTVVNIASWFLKKGQLIVIEKDRAGNQTKFSAGADGEFKDIPLKLLVNGGSASASEILAGCLQDHKRATLYGSPTFGKGLVQKTIPFQDGSMLKLTVERWYTPLGRSIQKDASGAGGVKPDVPVTVSKEDDAKLEEQLTLQLIGAPLGKDAIADPVLAAAQK